MKQFALKCIVAFSMVLALSACILTNPTEMRISVLEEQEYFSTSRKDDAAVELSLSKLPLADQYRLYMYTLHGPTPFNSHSKELIIQRGSAVVPFLLERLKASKNSFEAFGIYKLFSSMARAGIYYADNDDAVWQYLIARTTRSFTDNEFEASPILRHLVAIQELNPANATNAANVGKARLYSQVCSSNLRSSTHEACRSIERNKPADNPSNRSLQPAASPQ
jgi:hypothetical protein